MREHKWWCEMAPLSLVLKFHTFHISTRDEGRLWRLSAGIGRTRIMCKPVKSHLATQPCCRCSAAEIQTEPLWGREEGREEGREGGRAVTPLCSLPSTLSKPPPLQTWWHVLSSLLARSRTASFFLLVILAAASPHVPHDYMSLPILSANHMPTYFEFPYFKPFFYFTKEPLHAHILHFWVKRNAIKEISPS